MSLQLKLAWRYLWERRLRSSLTTMAIILGVMLIFSLDGIMPAVMDSFRRNLMVTASAVDLTVTSDSRGAFEPGAVQVVSDTPGVAHATGTLSKPLLLPAEAALQSSDGLPVSSIILSGIDPTTFAEVRSLSLARGRLMAPGEEDVVLIPEYLAERTGVDLGDTLAVPSASGIADLEIIGLFSGPPSIGAPQVYVPLATAQKAFNLGGRINTIEALFGSGAEAEAVRQNVLARLGTGYKLGETEAGAEILGYADMAEGVFTMFGVLALAMAGFIIFNTFRTIVVERKRDIGMLRSIGASRRTIVGTFVMESLVQGVVGTGIGLVVGYLFIVGTLAAINPIWEQRVGFPMGTPSFTTKTYVLSIVMGIGVALVAGLSPARAASRLSPLEALRPSTAGETWRVTRRRGLWGLGLAGASLLGLISGNLGLSALGILLFVVGLVMMAPMLIHPIARIFGRLLDLVLAREGHIARGNVMRQPDRAAITASAVMLGLAIVLAVAGMVTSLISGIFAFVDRSMSADYLVMPQSAALGGGNIGAGPDLRQRIQALPGIAETTSLRLSPARIGEIDIQLVGIDPETYPVVSALDFSAGQPEEVYGALVAGDALIANDLFAVQAQLEVGQTVKVMTPEGPRNYLVAGIGTDYVNMKVPTCFVSQANLERDFHETSDLLIMVNQNPEADADQVHAGLAEITRHYPALSLYATQEWRQDLVKEGNAKLAMLYVLLGVLAAPSLLALVNTLGINVLERTRELGMMRAVGATRKQVRRMILGESLLLSAAGTAFGILAGLWLGYILVEALTMTGVRLPYFFPYAGILTTIAVGLLLGVLGALIPARHAARLDIITALQYE